MHTLGRRGDGDQGDESPDLARRRSREPMPLGEPAPVTSAVRPRRSSCSGSAGFVSAILTTTSAAHRRARSTSSRPAPGPGRWRRRSPRRGGGRRASRRRHRGRRGGHRGRRRRCPGGRRPEEPAAPRCQDGAPSAATAPRTPSVTTTRPPVRACSTSGEVGDGVVADQSSGFGSVDLHQAGPGRDRGRQGVAVGVDGGLRAAARGGRSPARAVPTEPLSATGPAPTAATRAAASDAVTAGGRSYTSVISPEAAEAMETQVRSGCERRAPGRTIDPVARQVGDEEVRGRRGQQHHHAAPRPPAPRPPAPR